MAMGNLHFGRRIALALAMFVAIAAGGRAADAGAIADVKPPFTFKIRVQTADGKPQPGLEVRCLHPRAERGKPIVDMTAVSDETGVAQFNVTLGDLAADRFFWFTFDEDKWCGNSGVGVSPLDNEFEETFIVAPAEEFKLRVTDEHGAPIDKARIFMFTDHPKFPNVESGILFSGLGTTTTTEGIGTIHFADVPVVILTSAKGHASSFARGARLTRDKPYEITLLDGQTVRGKVLDDKGKPLGGVSLRAKRTDFSMNYSETFILNGETSPDGRFELKNAPAGQYQVSAVLKDARLPLSFDAAAVSVGATKSPNPVTLKAKPGAVIRGKYFTTQPKLKIADRRIDVYTHDENGAFVSQEFKTAADGSFSLTVPPDQRGQIMFMGVSGFSEQIVIPKALGFLRARNNNADFDAIPAGVHEGLEVHFKLSAMVQGVVRDADGNPVPELAVVTKYIRETDAKGAFRTEIDPNTTVTLEVQVPDENQTLYTSEPFYVSEGQVVTKDVQLPRSAKAIIKKSQNKDNAIVGRVVGPDGKPVAGAKVTLGNTTVLSRNYGTPTWQGGTIGPASLRTDKDGSFTFNVLMAGRTDLWAEDARNCGFVRDVRTDEVEGEIKLAPKEEKVSVKGALLGADGKPEAGARVLAYVNTGRPAVAAQTLTDGAGRFSAEFTPKENKPNQYVDLLAVSKSGAIAWKMLPCAPVDGLKIQFKQPAGVSGRVANKDGKPVAGVKVTLYDAADDDYGKMFFLGAMESDVPSAVTDADGRFKISGIPAGGTISLRARHPSYSQSYAWSVPVGSDRNEAKEIVLENAMRISGTVRHAETKKPAADTTVTLETSTDVKCIAVTDADGQYAMNVTDYVSSPMNLTATGDGWEGAGVFEKQFRAGMNVTGLDFTVHKSLAARQAEWRTEPGRKTECKSMVAVIDDADPDFQQNAKHHDTFRLYDGAGSQQWVMDDFNTCEASFGVHTIAWNAADQSIWSVETVSGRLMKTGLDGKLIWQNERKPDEKIRPSALAIDPRSGNIWVLTNVGNGLLVLSPDGNIIKDLPIGGSDIAYSPHDDCFWVVGKKVQKVGRDGKVLFTSTDEAAWLFGTIAVSARDGSVWVCEARHPQIAGSKQRVLVFSSNGKLKKEIALEERPKSIVIDDEDKCVWIATWGNVLKANMKGKIVARAPIKANSIDVEPGTGCVWVGAEDGVYRLDPQGRMLAFIKSKGDSDKWVKVIPR